MELPIGYRKRNDRLYWLWNGMKSRCYSQYNPSYKYYGEKGIGVCEEWQNDFFAFREWAVSNGYDYSKSRREQSLDRIDGSKNYSPSNCRFVSHSENCKNTLRNVFIDFRGKRKCINDWSKETGIPIETIRNRMKHTDNPEEIFKMEKMSHRSNTGIKGITLNKRGKYVVYINHRYIGVTNTIQDAIQLKEERK